MKLLIIYLIAINVITFFLFAVDKYKAIKHKWRIRESVLLLFSLFGGALGGYFAMLCFRHKTQTAIFKFGVPFMLILHISAAVYFILK